MREEDLFFAEQCTKLADTTSSALQWVHDNESLVGAQYHGLVKSLKKQASESRKLSRAAQRPLSVGIFGPSQQGKSFMMQGFISETKPDVANSIERVGRVVFGNEGEEETLLDFLDDVNPTGGRETTGLVTRFTLQKTASPAGFPVCLRLFKEIDIVKILANSFVFDLTTDAVHALEISYVSKIIADLEKEASESIIDNLAAEDIYELQEYFENSLWRHPLAKSEVGEWFWDKADYLIPRLKGDKRLKAFSLLWGEIPQFNHLYTELKAALDQLGHPEWAFAPLSAITDNTPGKTILHVLTVKEGLDSDKSNETTQLVTLDGGSALLRKPVVTALAFEMIAQLEKGLYDFLQTTDLLDFPGARSRYDTGREKFFNSSGEEYPLGEAFVRGKVAVMFDNYSADYDLNTLIACHKTAQCEVTSFPQLVEDWIQRTHGVTAAERVGKPVNILFTLTWCDQFFVEAKGQADKVVKLSNLLNVLDQFTESFQTWTPGKRFNNAFLIRNPAGSKLESIFDCKVITDKGDWIEEGIKEASHALLSEYKESFLNTTVAQDFFEDPALSWDEMIKPNDGGLTNLARALGGICKPDVKFNQIQPKAKKLVNTLQQQLHPFFEDGDIEARIKKRIADISEVINHLKPHPDLVPKFVSEFQVSEEKVRAIYLEFRRNKQQGASISKYKKIESAGVVLVSAWLDGLTNKYNNEIQASFYSLEPGHMRCVAGELEAAARLVEMPMKIDRCIENIDSFSLSAAKVADHVSTAVSVMLNEFVGYLGCKGAVRILPEPESPVFQQRVQNDLKNGLPNFPSRLSDMDVIRNDYAFSWLETLKHITKVNASSANGSLVNVEQNSRLGGILDSLEEIA